MVSKFWRGILEKLKLEIGIGAEHGMLWFQYMQREEMVPRLLENMKRKRKKTTVIQNWGRKWDDREIETINLNLASVHTSSKSFASFLSTYATAVVGAAVATGAASVLASTAATAAAGATGAGAAAAATAASTAGTGAEAASALVGQSREMWPAWAHL